MSKTSRFTPVAQRIGFLVAGISLGVLAGSALSLDSALRNAGLYETAIPLIRSSLLTRRLYVEPLTDQVVKQHILSGFIDSLDPHSSYLPPRDYSNFKQNLSGSYGGIGVNAERANDHVIVSEILRGSPAFNAGLQKGDEIVSINQQTLTAENYADLFSQLRGPIGESVKISILRPTQLVAASGPTAPLSTKASRLDVTIVRAAIIAPSVQWRLLPMTPPQGSGDQTAQWTSTHQAHPAKTPQTLLLKVRTFNEKTPQEAYLALQSALQSGANISSIMLDLRDNPGGLVTSAVGLSSFFLKEDSVVVVSARKQNDPYALQWRARFSDWGQPGETDYAYQAKRLLPQLEQLPMAVLVNSHSASAAEIVASALKDWQRASIVGVTTFGKGSVQTFLPISDKDGAMKITTSRYYTPKGFALQALGVTPDVLVNDPDPAGEREADIPGHLKSETILPSRSRYPFANVTGTAAPLGQTPNASALQAQPASSSINGSPVLDSQLLSSGSTGSTYGSLNGPVGSSGASLTTIISPTHSDLRLEASSDFTAKSISALNPPLSSTPLKDEKGNETQSPATLHDADEPTQPVNANTTNPTSPPPEDTDETVFSDRMKNRPLDIYQIKALEVLTRKKR